MPSRAGTEKIHDFFITTVSGLEKAVLESLRAQLAGATGFETESDRRNGRIYFHYTRSPVKLTAVRSALAAAGVVSRFRGVTVGGPGLERVCERLRRTDLSAARNLVRACHPETDVDSYQLACTLSGSHRFTRGDVEDRVRTILTGEHGLEPAGKSAGLRLRLRISGPEALFCVQIGPRRHPGGPERGLSEAMIASLMTLLEPGPEDVVLCLNCQESGLAELSRSGPRRVVALGDGGISLPPRTIPGVRRVAAAPAALPFEPRSASCVIDGTTRAGILDRLEAFAAVLAPGGVAVIPFADLHGVMAGLRTAQLPFEILAVLPLHIGGRPFKCCILECLW